GRALLHDEADGQGHGARRLPRAHRRRAAGRRGHVRDGRAAWDDRAHRRAAARRNAVSTRPRLLLVDDDETFRERLGRALASRELEVVTAARPDTALASARSARPAYAVVDLKMPDGSGLDLVRDLVALDPAIRVVVLTGYG